MQIRCTQADHKNQQIIGFCINCTCPNQRPYCHFCLPSHGQHLNGLTSQELLAEWMQERTLMVQNVQKNVQECKIALDSLINLFLPYYNFNIQQFPELGLSQIDQLIKDLCQTGDCEEKLFKQLKQSIKQIKQIVDEILKKIKNQTNIKKNDHFQIQQNLDKQILEQPKHQCIFKPNINSFTFKIMNQYSIKQTELCSAVAFNKDCSIVAAGCQQQIKIYQFKQGMLKLNQVLNGHQRLVTALRFMKQSNQLISGDNGGYILIWSYNTNSWIYLQTIKKHSDWINCLILNNNDDLFISCSDDKTIKFWVKQNQWICSQTISGHTHFVHQLSLNEQQNQVISCGSDCLILVIEYSECNKKWIVIQQIKVNCSGFRLCFINNNQFTFSPRNGNLMNVYEMNSVSKQFTKTKDITLNQGNDGFALFPQQFIRQKQLLVNKHDKYVNLIRKTQNGEFKVEQSIQFNTNYLCGELSYDGKYLITWDNSSQEIQIRRYTEE